MRGFHGKLSPTMLEHVRASPEVAFVEQDTVVQALDIEKGAPWGLARVSHRRELGFGTFNKVRRLCDSSHISDRISTSMSTLGAPALTST